MKQLILLLVCLCTTDLVAATPVLRVVKAKATGSALLRNSGFEQLNNGKLTDWLAAPQGYAVAANQGRRGSRALRCQNSTGEGWFGASQTLTLSRTNVAPLVVRGWSKAEGVTGSADSGYSLYIDILYADGSSLWGQTGNFRCGTHDWEQREFVILPDKPVKTLTLHCLFRGHAGEVWFDDLSVEEMKAEANAVVFQGVPVRQIQTANLKSPPEVKEHQTGDGLKLGRYDQTVYSLQLGERELSTQSPSGFLARNVAADSDIYAFDNGVCPDLGLKIDADFVANSNHIVVQGRVSDNTRQDRAVTLLFALPLDAVGWRWGDDIHRSRVIQGSGEFANQVGVRCGATGTMSLYPVAAIWDDHAGLALALDMAQPAQYRLGYHAGTQQLFIAYDFGLAMETERFPNSAAFRFLIYRFDPHWGFRAAWQKYMEIFPDYFRVRAREQGIWMPFTDVSKVEGWQDFGFRFHEGNNNVSWDDEHGILSFRYTEPMTWWMTMRKESPRTLAEAFRIRDELALRKNESQRRMAKVSRIAAMQDEAGQPSLLFRNEPWCNGAVWSLNPNPHLVPLPGDGTPSPESTAPTSDAGTPAGTRPALSTLNAATVHWNESIKQQLYGPTARGKLDGEYLDSIEGYVTADLNFRREHFRQSTVPLSFATDTKHPALFKGLAVFEFTKWFCDDVHRLDKLTFANGVPYRFTFLCPWLDVLGTETDWLRGGKYQPASDVTMSLWRTLSGAKPYLLLMNTDYDKFTPDLVEKYFQRCLFYGMWPGFFSHNAADNPYWQNPKWYNRDRPLFKRYIPLVKRVAEAGWQPVTEAACDNEKIRIERFGASGGGTVYFTLFNDTAQPQSGTWVPIMGAAQPKPPATAVELISNRTVARAAGGWRVDLQPQQTAVFAITK